jgi:erythromycin esterase-like protein
VATLSTIVRAGLARAAILLLTISFASLVPANAAPGAVPAARPINLEKSYEPRDYAFIGEAVGDTSVVGLGESIHLTREMPRVRLNLIRYLHQRKGFDVLALEGSTIDAWTAQEHAYSSRAPLAERARSFTREALFGLWQTQEMQEVIAYAFSTQGGPNPLYLTSFDIQPGTARAHEGSGENSLRAFLLALRRHDQSVSEEQIARWAKTLDPAITMACKGNADLSALREINVWVQGRASAALARHRPPRHVAALRLVPTMLSYRLEHCRSFVAADRSMQVYQEQRDIANAKLALAILGISNKLLLWAHHSHLHHNSLGKAVPSMGQHLKRTLGDRLYTIGVFAHRGAAVDTSKADSAKGLAIVPALAARPIPDDERFGVENMLAAFSTDDFFVNLKDAPEALAKPSFSRLESEGRLPTALARDFDGAILLHRIEGAELNFLPPAMRGGLRAVSWVYQNALLTALIAALTLGLLIWAGRSLWRRRSRRKSAA